ncbi:hypothetical protein AMATHDRAFT_42092 [Amanita thiersii Skay4041]|uniref:6-phosphofructo-2-kinase domain-containing protein n=1 Tax=Amanita thiersii Skay4041 TaxID=703135 RepID=A0A2A9NF37_9AGAR|nr:hypothetical protein AMATHDRAFT_42092 [Amanita thiersii Skay4041]
MVAPLYTTASGLLFHAGKILILTVGLPARGKTHISRALERYLRWMGVKTQVVSLGDYRRKTLGGAQKLPRDYFTLGEKSPETVKLRQRVAEGCEALIWSFFESGGQVVIYDANNGRRKARQALAEKFDKAGIHVVYLETLCDNPEIIENNIRSVKISSPDACPLSFHYRGWDPDKAVQDYFQRISDHEKYYETVEETEWPFIKIINVGEKMEVNNIRGYLQSRIVFFLMNIHNRYRTIWFARSGQSLLEHSYKADSDLSPAGWDYAEKLKDFLLERRAKNFEAKGLNPSERRLVIWTSTRRRAHHTAWPFLAAAQTSMEVTNAQSESIPTSAPVAAGASTPPTVSAPAGGAHPPSLALSSTAPVHPSPLSVSTISGEEGNPLIRAPAPHHVPAEQKLLAPPFSPSPFSTPSIATLSHPATPPSPFSTPPLPPLANANPAIFASPMLNIKVVEKPQMLEINPGIWDGLTPDLAKRYYPEDWLRFVKDPYSYRAPRAESYHDLSVRLEPILIELEREKEDLLIIGHASVIRCLLAYLIGLPASEIPAIEIARGDLLEVVPTSYGVVSQAYHFWDGPGRRGGDGDDLMYPGEEGGEEEIHVEEEEVTGDGQVRRVLKLRRAWRDVNNFYENYAEDTKGKRVRQGLGGGGMIAGAQAEVKEEGEKATNVEGEEAVVAPGIIAGIGAGVNVEMDNVLRAVGGLGVVGAEVKKDPEVTEGLQLVDGVSPVVDGKA